MKTLVLSVPYPWFFSLVAPIFNTFSSLFWFEFQIFKKNYIYIYLHCYFLNCLVSAESPGFSFPKARFLVKSVSNVHVTTPMWKLFLVGQVVTVFTPFTCHCFPPGFHPLDLGLGGFCPGPHTAPLLTAFVWKD